MLTLRYNLLFISTNIGGDTISNFEFDNITSHKFGLVIGSTEHSGIKDINTYSDMEVFQDRVGNRPAPFFYGTKLSSNLEFPMEIYSKHSNAFFSNFEVRAIQSWLFGRRKPKLLTIYDPDKGDQSYECWLTEPQVTKLNNKVIGWKFTVVCTSPYSISSTIEKRYECNTENYIIKFHNLSDAEDYLYPEMNIQLEPNTTFVRIENKNDNNRVFQFTDLRRGENIYINNDLGIITSINGSNVYQNFNLKFFRFVEGYNELHVTGKCIITFRYREFKAVGGH